MSDKRKYSIKQYKINNVKKSNFNKPIKEWLIDNKKNMMVILVLIAVVFVIVFYYNAFLVSSEVEVEKKDETIWQEIEEDIDSAVMNIEASNQAENASTPEYINKYVDINMNTIGYIKIDNTKIDYPVVQTDNNDYYINHNHKFEPDKAGAIFMDFRCDIDDFSKTRNIILYGHRMKDGSMFKDLTKYQDIDFCRENTIIKFDTLNGEYLWKVFTVFETSTDFYYIDTEFPYDETWIGFLEHVKKMSIHESYTNFYPEDIILTLSTCTTEEDGRFVVMAKLMR